ncbi:MAG TPA: oligosaccharide flippase family protein, partial [Wenzhouxiangella sp.]|nr:oligosaccharide flippase family protein [Wenzhouxiangella sp.]
MNDRRQSLKSWAAGIRGSAVVRSGSTAGVIKGVGLVMAFLLQMLLARLVADPAQYGAYAWGQSMLFLLGSLFALGIPLATSRLVAIHASHGDHVSLAGVRRSGMRWLALSALTGATLAAILVVSLPASAFEELSRPIALVAAFASPLATFMLFHQAMARAQSHLVFAFLPTQVLRPLLAGLLAVAWFLWIQSRPGGIEILLAVCASLALVLAIQMSVVYRHRPNAEGRAAPQTGSTAREQRYGSERIMPVALPIFATRLFDLLAQYGNVFILGMLAGPLAAAGFFVAERLSRL